MKSELDRYLEDELVPLSKDKFSVLDWWKVGGTRYPTLRLLARDIFATPISMVALESAFNTSGGILVLSGRVLVLSGRTPVIMFA